MTIYISGADSLSEESVIRLLRRFAPRNDLKNNFNINKNNNSNHLKDKCRKAELLQGAAIQVRILFPV